ncbi:MAG: U32 family peptidase [Firmicutes bacterium]|nr:U32 family peptidase [Bacillota bacterium]
MVELLAPAGDKERLEFALLYGADAVYFGGKDFSLRANAKNFSREDITYACAYAHSLNKKVYVTVNIVFHNDDIDGLEDYLRFLKEVKVDGIICSDILVLKKIKELKINTKVILSTQASTLNHEAAKFYKSLGVNQVVLAREALKEDIQRIKKETGLEIECFVHGAMCTSISGKCIMSNYMTNRDSNRGGCAQICRWVFNEDDEVPFTMTPKDLNFIDYIGDMIKSGVNTFKVEGRMRSIYYIATVILCYRRVIDKILKGTLTSEDKAYYLKILNRCANRESAPQFYHKLPTYKEQYYALRDEESNQDFLGIVKDYDERTHLATIEERNLFKVGDKVEFIGPNLQTFEDTVTEIYDEDGNPLEVANKPRMIIKIKVSKPVSINDLMRVKIN